MKVDGKALLERVKSKLGDDWLGELEDIGREQVALACEDFADLTEKALSGEDVSSELAHAKARIANWTFVGASKAATIVKEAVAEVGEFVGSVFKGFIG